MFYYNLLETQNSDEKFFFGSKELKIRTLKKGDKSRLARHPDWDSAILSPRVVDRSLKNMTIRNAVHGHNHPGRLIDGLRWETEVTPRTQKDVYGAMIDKE